MTSISKQKREYFRWGDVLLWTFFVLVLALIGVLCLAYPFFLLLEWNSRRNEKIYLPIRLSPEYTKERVKVCYFGVLKSQKNLQPQMRGPYVRKEAARGEDSL